MRVMRNSRGYSRKALLLAAVCGVIAGCGSAPQKNASVTGEAVNNAQISKPEITTEVIPVPLKDPVGNYSAAAVDGDYADYKSVDRFINKMVKEHEYPRDYLNGLFSQVKRQDKALTLMERYAPSKKKRPANYVPQPSKGSWSRYRNKFITDENVDRGVLFWLENRKTLEQVEKEYGVPAEVIVGIIGVETRWGRITGNYVVLDALATIAFDYPRRSAYFTKELEEFLLMTREEGMNPRFPQGSYAGAMGLGQFMPSSFRKYAVDFDGDGVRDLWNATDAIASVANYFRGYGWQPGEPVAIRASYSGDNYRQIKWGYNSNYSLSELKRVGVRPRESVNKKSVSLLRFANYSNDELWLGMNNFYVITRYNHSSKYAMAAYQLGQAVNRRFRSVKQASILLAWPDDKA